MSGFKSCHYTERVKQLTNYFFQILNWSSPATIISLCTVYEGGVSLCNVTKSLGTIGNNLDLRRVWDSHFHTTGIKQQVFYQGITTRTLIMALGENLFTSSTRCVLTLGLLKPANTASLFHSTPGFMWVKWLWRNGRRLIQPISPLKSSGLFWWQRVEAALTLPARTWCFLPLLLRPPPLPSANTPSLSREETAACPTAAHPAALQQETWSCKHSGLRESREKQNRKFRIAGKWREREII